MDTLEGRATPEATKGYENRFPGVREMHGHRDVLGLRLCSIGLGTYLGDVSPERDEGYRHAVLDALQGGINVVDTAINYRHQRSERVVGQALRDHVKQGGVREEVFVATKGGYLPLDADVEDPHKRVQEDYVDAGLVTPENLVVDAHCMAPEYLLDQVERSRRNLGLGTIDLYYVHNPETQLAQVTHDVFDKRLEAAFVALEQAVMGGKIARYGIATWTGLRVPPDHKAHLDLERILELAERAAREAGAGEHHLAAVQAPLNLSMPEAVTARTQQVHTRMMPLAKAVGELGLAWFTSASIMQGRLARGLPLRLKERIAAVGDAAQTALQATRSAPGVSSALVGMSSPSHVKAALELLAAATPGASGMWPEG